MRACLRVVTLAVPTGARASYQGRAIGGSPDGQAKCGGSRAEGKQERCLCAVLHALIAFRYMLSDEVLVDLLVDENSMVSK